MLHLAKIPSFGINIPQFLVDLRVCSSLLGNLFVYPLCSTFFHAEPSWALNTKRGSKAVKTQALWQYLWLLTLYLKLEKITSWLLYAYIPSNRLTPPAPCISKSCIKIKINLKFYFHFSSWCLKKFYEGLWGLHKTFSGTTEKCENEN